MTELRGTLGSHSLPAVFLFLQEASKTGELRLNRDGVTRSFYVREGLVVGAESSARTDSLEWLLFRAGILSEERHREVKSRIDSGTRRGASLIETGGLSPATLCEWTENRVRFLAGEVLSWPDGEYSFQDSAMPPEGTILVRVPPRDAILKTLRGRGRLTPPPLPGEAVPARMMPLLPGECLEPHEDYVLNLADGHRTVADICRLSELGETMTHSVLSLLFSTGFLARGDEAAAERRGVPRTVSESEVPASLAPGNLGLPEGDAPTEIRGIVRIYNDLYLHIATTMFKEIGPIAEQLLEKTLQETRARHTTLFHRINTLKEGALPEETVIRNLNLIRDREPREALLSGLGEHLAAMLQAVRRILGPDHETRLVGQLRELRWTHT